MTWIKRNLLFVIQSVVALALLAWAGFYNYSRWKLNDEWSTKLIGQYAELQRLNTLNPHPGNEKVDNIKEAQKQRESVTNFMTRVLKQFEPIPTIPPPDRLTTMDFASSLRRTIEQLRRDATAASVAIQPNYSFAFQVEESMLTLAPASLGPLSVQLGEIKALSDIFIAAKVNALDGIRRERVCIEDYSPTAQTMDYLEIHSVTNDLAVISPYEVSFRCFTPELADVMARFANSPHCLVVKSVMVEPAPAAGGVDTSSGAPILTPMTPVPQVNPDWQAQRLGEEEFGVRRPVMRPQPVPQTYTTPVVVRGGLQTVINEKQLRVTMLVEIVKPFQKK